MYAALHVGVEVSGFERNFFVQSYYLSKRMMKENVRNPGIYWCVPSSYWT